jgi:restriction system protein
VAHADALGIKTPTIKVQVKRRQDRANVDSIRAFLAVLSGSDVGLFVCTGGFTKDAEEEARGQQLRRIMLINLKRLYSLWIEHYSRIPEEHRHLLPLKPVHYLALQD